MRDYVLTAFIFALLPVCVARPWLGILTWYWFGLMNPHRLTWDFAYTMQFGLFIAVATLLGLPFAKDSRPIPWNPVLALIVVLMAYFTMTSYFAWAPAVAWVQWEKVMKIVFMTFIATKLIYGRDRIRALLLVIVVSIGFYGVKGGINSILNGGAIQIKGPEGSFLEGNTFIGLAFNMVMPLMIILAREETRTWAKRGLYISAALTVVATIFTYSRGAYVGLVILLPLLFLQARKKVVAAAILIPAVLIAPYVIPEAVFQRADQIENYEDDSSANSRLFAWNVAYNIAKAHPLTGAGFEFEYAGDDVRWLSYAKEGWGVERARGHALAAHSIYFQVMGQHGGVGFLLYATMLVAVMVSLQRTKRIATKTPDLAWVATYATAIQVGMIGYLVSGAFLSSAYFDLAWLYFAFSAILAREVKASVADNTLRSSRGYSANAPPAAAASGTSKTGTW